MRKGSLRGPGGGAEEEVECMVRAEEEEEEGGEPGVELERGAGEAAPEELEEAAAVA
jgi:hypothetical protein